jgi:hypothetical protein
MGKMLSRCGRMGCQQKRWWKISRKTVGKSVDMAAEQEGAKVIAGEKKHFAKDTA